MNRRTLLLGAAALAASPAALAGPAPAPTSGKPVRIAYVEWSDAVVSSNILAAVLQDMGHEVTLIPVSGAAMWQAVASGDADCMLAGWLPTTHAAYYARLRDQVDLVGPNFTGARIGWATPDYTPLISVADLATRGDLVDNTVIGIDAGAGLMRASETAIEAYGLGAITLVDGSEATMVGALQEAIGRNKPIVVTIWTPHWMFATHKLRFLADPKGCFGCAETVNTVARRGLKADMPDVYAVLGRFKLTLDDEQALMLQNQAHGADPARTASAWVAANAALVKAWRS